MNPAIAALAAVLAATAALFELRRAERRNLGLRLLAAIVAAVSLCLLLDPPAVTAVRRAQLALLVTPEADPALIARVADSLRPGFVFDSDSLRDLRTIRRRNPGLRELVIVGSGVEGGELQPLAGIAVRLVPSRPARGVTVLRSPVEAALGETIEIAGRAAPRARLELDGVGASDSTTADSGGGFTLRATPRAAGLARLALRSGGAADTVAVFVRDAPPPAVAILRAGPSFEASRLRDWLAERGARAVTDVDVSSGRSRATRVNTGAGPLRPLTAAVLDSFDVLWADARVLRRLGPGERVALRAAVTAGLGLLLEPAALDAARAIFGEPFPRLASGPEARTARMRWADGRAFSPTSLEPGTLTAGAPHHAEAVDERGRPVQLWIPLGAGRVYVTMVARPSRWLREGDRAAWDAYWSRMLGVLRRPEPRWELDGFPFAPDRAIAIRRAGERPLTATVAGPTGGIDTVHLERDGVGHVSARFWPVEAGIHTLRGEGDSLVFEVPPANSWGAVRAAQRREATEQWIAINAADVGGADSEPARQPLPRVWIFTVLLGALSYLWWERRSA